MTTETNGTSNGEGKATTPCWDGNNMTQNDMMLKDTCIVLDDDDNVTGSASKKEAHVFNEKQPRGILHRAFSVFLFDESTQELLLQKRASTKITFPNVWTNTCCSHPLHGMEPPEVDTPNDVAEGTVLGAKNAAIRKLDHELGIPSSEVPVEKFKFLTRLHYWAADTVTHGKQSPWGEHEIDYVLFIVVPNKESVTMKPHPDEVDDVAWVSQTKLQEMFQDKSLLFSPWFRLICQKWLCASSRGWWDNLKLIMETTEFDDFEQIHEFDPPVEHLGGGGNAGLLFAKKQAGEEVAEKGEEKKDDECDNQKKQKSVNDDSKNVDETKKIAGDATKKQGAYGKIKTHKESKFQQLKHVDEVFAAITMLYVKPLESNLDTEYIRNKFDKDSLEFCDDILVSVSRSFAAVIRQLPPKMLVDILVFYLVLRALDTIEDDTVAFKDDLSVKIDYLMRFTDTALSFEHPGWTLDGVGEGDERRLLQNFDKCFNVFASLQKQSQVVITDITNRMATGMAQFVTKDLGQGTKNIAQYNRYCHFVAGLVGEGLTSLFACSGYENPSIASDLRLCDQMGLFLQKTNIIRDYLEDYVDERAWWPQSVWSQYSPSGDLGYFALQQQQQQQSSSSSSDEVSKNVVHSNKSYDLSEIENNSLYCLNELINNALESVPHCLVYLSKLRCAEIFRFCAIPQVMAIATLDKCYGNRDVFTGVVKIRKGLSCKLILRTNTIDEVHETFYMFAKSIMFRANQLKKQRKENFNDPNYERTLEICQNICDLTQEGYQRQRSSRYYYNWILPATLTIGCIGATKLLDSSPKTTVSSTSKKIGKSAIFGLGVVLYKYVLGPKSTYFTDADGTHVLKAAEDDARERKN